MKDFYKNPTFYYVIIPVLIALWSLSILFIHLPGTKKLERSEASQHNRAKQVMDEILTLDPLRLVEDSNDQKGKEFDYAVAINQIAGKCGIINYNISADKPRPEKNRDSKTQTATIVLQKVDIEKFADFLSSLLLRWANLECQSINIDRQKGLPDAWKVTLKFKYIF